MPAKRFEDYSSYIIEVLSSSPKTFEFIALSLATLMGQSEESRKILAKSSITKAAKKYFDLEFIKNTDRNKKIVKAFKRTLIESLLTDFDEDKAAKIIFNYCHLDIFERKMDKYFPGTLLAFTPGFITDTRKKCLKSEVDEFFKPQTAVESEMLALGLTDKKLEEIILDQYFTETPATIKFAYYLLLSVAIVTIAFYKQTRHLISEYENINYLALMGFLSLELIAVVITGLFIAPRALSSATKKHEKLCRSFQENFIKQLPSLLVEIPQKNNNAIYHFPLFTSPQLFKSPEAVKAAPSHDVIATKRTHEKTKKRASYTTHKPVESADLARNQDALRKNGIKYHRIYNHAGIATQDFIGINSTKLNVNNHELNALKLLIKSPRIVSVKGRSGIVRSEKHDQLSGFGLFKIKDKGLDVRVHTNNCPEKITFNAQPVTLHTADLAAKHVSKKNH